MDIIKNRRSRRNFTSKKVSIDDIKKIVEAGTYAHRNEQTRQYNCSYL